MKSMVESKNTIFTIEEIGGILGAESEGAPEFRRAPVTGVKIDSRLIEPGDLFVAVKGEHSDGHDYLNSALKNGATGVLVSKTYSINQGYSETSIFKVNDTVYALGQLGKHYRNKMRAKIIAVTGSNGKTTIKNMIFEVISRLAPSIKSQGNYNNFLGLPLSIFQLKDHHRYGVFELGMSAIGEISRLGEIAAPDVAVISNVGPVHLEFFKDIEEIAAAKLEILDRIKPGGIFAVNGDDRFLKDIKSGNMEILKFGLSEINDVYPVELKFDANQLAHFKIDDIEIRLKLPGMHNVYNALACLAVAKALGIDSNSAAKAIMEYEPADMRSEIHRKSGITFYIDCYNANPVSMKYAIDTLASMECRGRRIAVLGDMLELGRESEQFHTDIGRHARVAGIDLLLAYGELSKSTMKAFEAGAEHFDDKGDLYNCLKALIKKDDLILFKASRGMALEDVACKLLEAL